MFLSDPVLCFYVHAGCGLLWQTTIPLRRYSEPSKTFPMKVDPGGLAWHSSFWSTLFSAPSSDGILSRRYAALHSEVDCYTLKKRNLNLGNFWQHVVSQALGKLLIWDYYPCCKNMHVLSVSALCERKWLVRNLYFHSTGHVEKTNKQVYHSHTAVNLIKPSCYMLRIQIDNIWKVQQGTGFILLSLVLWRKNKR